MSAESPHRGKPRPATRAVHAFTDVPPGTTRPAAPPIHPASVYFFEDLEHVERVQEGREQGYLYGRYATPNVDALQRAVAALEGAPAALAAASGMAAIAAVLTAAAGPGGRILAGRDLYGETVQLLSRDLPAMGHPVRFVDAVELEALEQAARDFAPQVIYVETITNPRVRVVDVAAAARIARGVGARLVVDNTFASPVLFRPLEHGADVTVHSATKYLGGHGDLVAGVAAGSREVIEAAVGFTRRFGSTLDAFSAWLVLRGMATLDLRVRRQSDNALHLARHLQQHPAVEQVLYAGLETDPHHGRARRLLPEGCGGMLAFQLAGGAAAASTLFRHLTLIRFAPSLGDVKTTVSHPARTSHRSLTPEQRTALGIGEGLVRLSAGIEDPDDLLEDLDRALAALA